MAGDIKGCRREVTIKWKIEVGVRGSAAKVARADLIKCARWSQRKGRGSRKWICMLGSWRISSCSRMLKKWAVFFEYRRETTLR